MRRPRRAMAFMNANCNFSCCDSQNNCTWKCVVNTVKCVSSTLIAIFCRSVRYLPFVTFNLMDDALTQLRFILYTVEGKKKETTSCVSVQTQPNLLYLSGFAKKWFSFISLRFFSMEEQNMINRQVVQMPQGENIWSHLQRLLTHFYRFLSRCVEFLTYGPLAQNNILVHHKQLICWLNSWWTMCLNLAPFWSFHRLYCVAFESDFI